MKGALTEDQVRSIVVEEIRKTFQGLAEDMASVKKDTKELQSGINRIERLLQGDKDYEDEGMAKQIKIAYEHARQVTEQGFVEKQSQACAFIEAWEKEGKWKILGSMIDNYKMLKALILFTGLGTLTGAINLVLMFVNFIQHSN